MTNRQFLLGLGIGFIVSSLIVFGLLSVEQSSENPILPHESVLTQEEIENQINAARQEGYEAGKEDAAAQEPPSPDSIFIYISKGYSGTEVGALLMESGLIKDESSFNKVVKDRNVERSIKAGVYGIPVGASEEEIIDIITD